MSRSAQSRSDLAPTTHYGALRARRPSRARAFDLHHHRFVAAADRGHSTLRGCDSRSNCRSSRRCGVLGAYAYRWLMQDDAQDHSPLGHPTSASRERTLPGRRATQARRLPTPHPDRPRFAQGLLQCLAIQHIHASVWSSFWFVAADDSARYRSLRARYRCAALRNSLPDFLAQQRDTSLFKKFIRERIEPANCAPLRLAG